MLNIPGFTFPVRQFLLEDVLELLQSVSVCLHLVLVNFNYLVVCYHVYPITFCHNCWFCLSLVTKVTMTFAVYFFVCFFICQLNYSKSYKWVLVKSCGEVGLKHELIILWLSRVVWILGHLPAFYH